MPVASVASNSSRPAVTRDQDIHIRISTEGKAALQSLADQESRSLSSMAQVLLAEAMAARPLIDARVNNIKQDGNTCGALCQCYECGERGYRR